MTKYIKKLNDTNDKEIVFILTFLQIKKTYLNSKQMIMVK